MQLAITVADSAANSNGGVHLTEVLKSDLTQCAASGGSACVPLTKRFAVEELVFCLPCAATAGYTSLRMADDCCFFPGSPVAFGFRRPLAELPTATLLDTAGHFVPRKKVPLAHQCVAHLLHDSDPAGDLCCADTLNVLNKKRVHASDMVYVCRFTTIGQVHCIVTSSFVLLASCCCGFDQIASIVVRDCYYRVLSCRYTILVVFQEICHQSISCTVYTIPADAHIGCEHVATLTAHSTVHAFICERLWRRFALMLGAAACHWGCSHSDKCNGVIAHRNRGAP